MRLLHQPRRLGSGERRTDHADALTLKESARGDQETRAVVDDQAPQHGTSLVAVMGVIIPANWTHGRWRAGYPSYLQASSSEQDFMQCGKGVGRGQAAYGILFE